MITFDDIVFRVLKEEKRAITGEEIWEVAQKKGYDKELRSIGKTPVATIVAAIYKNISENKDESIYLKGDYRPTKFFLKEYNNIIDKSTFKENPKIKKEENIEIKIPKTKKIKISDLLEKDLHQFLVYFANKYLKCYCKTIRHNTSAKKDYGEWLHPDIVGCYFPIEEWQKKDIYELSSTLGNNSIKFFSFEMKRKLDFNNLREAFFQSVSNSSWANEGYLVAAEISETDEFRNELKRLSNSFGIGVIKLEIKDPDSSEIIFQAKSKENIDWDMVYKLSMNNDFKEFLNRVKKDIFNKEIITERFDKVYTVEDLIKDIEL